MSVLFVSVQNFEAAVQDNVLVNGLPWEEAADVEGDPLYRCKTLSNKSLRFPSHPCSC